MKRLSAFFAVLMVLAPAAGSPPQARHHMIAAANPLAAKAGLEMLRQGGSAVDAAIAAQMVLTLVEPESSGLGGGAFMLLWDPGKQRITSFDGRETAPASSRPEMFLDASGNPRPHLEAIPGGLSVGVPGVVAMLELAHKKYGKLPWAKLFDPAIKLAETGVPVTAKLAGELRDNPQIAAMPDVKRYFTRTDGTLVKAGDTLRNPDLAATFRAIAKGGVKAFYTGEIARAIVAKVRHAPVNPGGMTLQDLAHYRAVERPPVCGNYRQAKVCSMGPPSSGGIAVLQILSMLERFKPQMLQPGTVQEIHLVSQASRLAFADRSIFIGDPAFVHVPLQGLLDRRYLQKRALSIDPRRDMGEALPGNLAPYAPGRGKERQGTSHISIADDTGQVVSMTTTVEYLLGSEMMAKGFFLNNELTDFSFLPVRDGKPVANAVAPGKRPMSAMSPTIVFENGRFWIALGSPGGPAIIPYVAGTLVAMIDGKLGPGKAAALPHHVEMNGPLFLEKDTPLAGLAPVFSAMGYDVRPASVEVSGLHIIQRLKDGYIGAADPRREGVVLGD
jgi:gamma-glutamyltranspeptidase / glutathione hydrolase